MSTQLQDKIAVVTGGARGIGQAITQALADQGASVVIALSQVPRGRLFEPDSVAAALAFPAGGAAPAMTGDTQLVGGGQTVS